MRETDQVNYSTWLLGNQERTFPILMGR